MDADARRNAAGYRRRVVLLAMPGNVCLGVGYSSVNQGSACLMIAPRF